MKKVLKSNDRVMKYIIHLVIEKKACNNVKQYIFGILKNIKRYFVT